MLALSIDPVVAGWKKPWCVLVLSDHSERRKSQQAARSMYPMGDQVE